MDDLWAAVGLMLVLEGAMYALFPNVMIEATRRLPEMPQSLLRFAGISAILCGWLIVKWVRG
jgi:hypothetical protein